MIVVIFFGLLCLGLLWAVVMLIRSYYKDVWLKRTRFYDRHRCLEIIAKYTGDEDERVLKALADGKLSPGDIKRYCNYGESGGIRIDQEYLLINRLDDEDYEIVTYHSGSGHSRLWKVEIDIIDGRGTIIKHWVCDS